MSANVEVDIIRQAVEAALEVQRAALAASRREYDQRPEVKARARERQRLRRSRPEVKALVREYSRKYYQRPEVKARRRDRYATDREYREREQASSLARYHRKKAEREAEEWTQKLQDASGN